MSIHQQTISQGRPSPGTWRDIPSQNETSQNEPSQNERTILPGSLDSGFAKVLDTRPRKSPARLTVAEKAFARGLKALKEKNYPEARRQLAGFLELTESASRMNASQAPLKQSHRLQGIRVVVESLQLLLAISEEITILEREVR